MPCISHHKSLQKHAWVRVRLPLLVTIVDEGMPIISAIMLAASTLNSRESGVLEAVCNVFPGNRVAPTTGEARTHTDA